MLEMVQQKPSFQEKTRFLFALYAFFLHEPFGKMLLEQVRFTLLG